MDIKKRFRIFLSALCVLSATVSATAVSPDYYASSSVLSSGRWVKIRINESGMQQITHEQLREWGFDDPSAVTVYGFGGVTGISELMDETMPDDLPQQPVVYADDKIVFYGESCWRPNMVYFTGMNNLVPTYPDVERNNAATAGYYFITDSKPVLTPTAIPYKANTSLGNLTQHWDISVSEEELNNPTRYGQLFFGRDLSVNKDSVSYSVPLADLAAGSSDQYARGVFHYILVSGGSTKTEMYVEYPNDKSTTTFTFSADAINANGTKEFNTNSDYSDSYKYLKLNKDATSADFKITLNQSRNYTLAYVDRLVFAYPRLNNMAGRASMLMCETSINQGRVIEVNNVNAGIQVWNVDDAHNVRPYEARFSNGNTRLTFTAPADYSIAKKGDKAHRAIVFDPAKEQNAVEYVGEVTNQDLHASKVPEFIIITPVPFADQAERLAQIHRDLLGQDVMVVNQEQIFNEFSSGTPSLWGIRKAMKMFYDRDPKKFKHLLLFGPGSYDNRGITVASKTLLDQDILLLNYGAPTHKLMSSHTTGYSCDGYFGMLCDTPPADKDFIYTEQNINVGRIPVSNEEEAIKAVDKVYQYLTYIPSSDVYQRVLLMADYGNSLQHMDSAEKAANSFLSGNPGLTLLKSYTGLYPLPDAKYNTPKDFIGQTLKQGVMYVNYTGHGKSDYLGMQNQYAISDVHANEYSYFPFAMLATCSAYTFDRLNQNITQEMVLQNNGGMIGVISSCREVYLPLNTILSEAMADIYVNSPRGTTTGDILRLSRNDILNDKLKLDSRLVNNTAAYNLCGDPAIPLYIPDLNIVLETVNGKAYTEVNGSHNVTPLADNSISGFVEDPSNPGSPMTSFNGKVILSMYESPEERDLITLDSSDKTQLNKPDREKKTITCDEDLLTEAMTEVVDGRFTIDFTPRMPMRRSVGYNRITLSAVVDDNSHIAKTYSNSLVCDPESAGDNVEDTKAPVITEMYINTPEFTSGDVTSQSFTAYATVEEAGSGILTTSNIGGTCRFTLDGAMAYLVKGSQLSNNGDGTYNVAYSFSSLADGRHTLTLYVSDNVGNSTTRSIDFIVNNDAANPKLLVAESPARIQATFTLSNNFNGTPAGRIVIEDKSGNTVYSREDVSFPFEWDLTDGNGNLVEDGVYSAYAICKGGTLYGATPKVDIIVLQQP